MKLWENLYLSKWEKSNKLLFVSNYASKDRKNGIYKPNL
jgi:hypothetical protein